MTNNEKDLSDKSVSQNREINAWDIIVNKFASENNPWRICKVLWIVYKNPNTKRLRKHWSRKYQYKCQSISHWTIHLYEIDDDLYYDWKPRLRLLSDI